jgi:PIN domain nuclease of toxin-antitoxin system
MGRDAMTELLVDTHVLIWMMEDNPRLSPPALQAIRQAVSDDCLVVSAITPWEIGLLVSKGRLKLNADVQIWVDTALRMPGVRVAPLQPEIAVASSRLPWEMHADPVDRVLVATARHIGATLVTADEQLLRYHAQGFLRCLPAA